jgi:hypothetical protein
MLPEPEPYDAPPDFSGVVKSLREARWQLAISDEIARIRAGLRAQA